MRAEQTLSRRPKQLTSTISRPARLELFLKNNRNENRKLIKYMGSYLL